MTIIMARLVKSTTDRKERKRLKKHRKLAKQEKKERKWLKKLAKKKLEEHLGLTKKNGTCPGD